MGGTSAGVRRIVLLFSILTVALLSQSPHVAAQEQETLDVETRVRAYFSYAPIMVEIARCESKFRQYSSSGKPLYGGYGGKMVGVFQVYTDIHASYAASLGMDITTLEGNLAYAKYLYDREGTKPWLSSFPCWGDENRAQSTAGNTSAGLSMNLSMGMEHAQVLELQKKLNSLGYTITAEGPGSPGNETRKFGALTRAAVRSFQCAQMGICAGDEHSTGYGFVGAKTREKLLGASPSTGAATASTTPIAATSTMQSGTATSPTPTYTAAEQQQIADLQLQILELTKLLASLRAS